MEGRIPSLDCDIFPCDYFLNRHCHGGLQQQLLSSRTNWPTQCYDSLWTNQKQLTIKCCTSYFWHLTAFLLPWLQPSQQTAELVRGLFTPQPSWWNRQQGNFPVQLSAIFSAKWVRLVQLGRELIVHSHEVALTGCVTARWMLQTEGLPNPQPINWAILIYYTSMYLIL